MSQQSGQPGARFRARFLERFAQADPVFLSDARLVDHPDGVVLEAHLPPIVRPPRVKYLAEHAHSLWNEALPDEALPDEALSSAARLPPLVAVRFMAAVDGGADELVRVSDGEPVWNADGLVHAVHWMWGKPEDGACKGDFENALYRLGRLEDFAAACPKAMDEALRRVLLGEDDQLGADLAGFLARFSRRRARLAPVLREALLRRLAVVDLNARERDHHRQCLAALDAPTAG